MSTGSDLESAITNAAKHYQAADRAELAKQLTPRQWNGRPTGKAPIDFKGWYGFNRAPLYVEAKATSDGHIEFRDEGDGIREKQLDAMKDAVKRGIHMLLVADFVTEKEVYVIDVKHVVAFAAAPWRKSISFYWARAYGELAKVSFQGAKRYVWFLDTKPSPLQSGAYLAVQAEKAKKAGTVVDLYPNDYAAPKKMRDRLATRPAPGTPEHREYLRLLIDEGIMNAAKRRRGWGRK